MSELQGLLNVIRSGNFLILDTETTGLERGEVVQIGIVDSSGTALMNTLVKPIEPIPLSTTRIHGITNQMVASAPRFADVVDQLRETINGQQVIVYNAVYDRRMLHQSAEMAGIEKTDWKAISRWWCAMEGFAEVYGDWNSMRRSYRWQKLATAARHYGLSLVDEHSALGDCLTTLAICKQMAEKA
jgi:DNA polymerase-3 subunit epsilon